MRICMLSSILARIGYQVWPSTQLNRFSLVILKIENRRFVLFMLNLLFRFTYDLKDLFQCEINSHIYNGTGVPDWSDVLVILIEQKGIQSIQGRITARFCLNFCCQQRQIYKAYNKRTNLKIVDHFVRQILRMIS